jgi:hypothetical protein
MTKFICDVDCAVSRLHVADLPTAVGGACEIGPGTMISSGSVSNNATKRQLKYFRTTC